MPDPRIILIGLMVAGSIYLGETAVKGVVKVGHAIVHVLKR